jgi:phosphate/phosphite/phosphonate ABC transporter binding protein
VEEGVMAKEPPSIWWWAFGYFAAYVPFAALTKVVTNGLIDTGDTPLTGVKILPLAVVSTVIAAAAFLIGTGWWRHAVKDVGGWRVPLPTRWTALSGLCASGIIATTTLAYTFKDATIVFVMLLMRGGVLVLAPVIDAITGRKIRWFSTAALALSILSLVTSVVGSRDPKIPLLCAIDIALYLAFYFVRLQIMSRKAKSTDPSTNLRYFVEEQLVSAPALLVFLAVAAATGVGSFGAELREGFVGVADWPIGVIALVIVIGVTSQGTGIFGGLVLLDRRENTFSIPVNRASSVLAGVVASAFIWVVFSGKPPPASDLFGAAIMTGAILVLSLGAIADRHRGPRPAYARRIVIVAGVIAAGAVALSVAVATRGRATAGQPRDPFVLVVSAGHANAEAGERLEAALAARTGLAIDVRVARDPEAALEVVGTAAVDAGLLPLFAYVLARQEFGVVAALQVVRGDGARDYGGVLLVRDDDPITGVAGLAGKRVAYVDRASTTGFLLPARHLADAGVAVEPVIAGSHDQALAELRAGRVTAAATHDGDARPGLRVLARTGAVPNEPVFFHRDVPVEVRDKIVAALIDLGATGDGDQLLRDVGGITGFVPVTDDAYAAAHELLAATQRRLDEVVPGAWRLRDRRQMSPGNLGP